jgi:hypothetical protein
MRPAAALLRRCLLRRAAGLLRRRRRLPAGLRRAALDDDRRCGDPVLEDWLPFCEFWWKVTRCRSVQRNCTKTTRAGGRARLAGRALDPRRWTTSTANRRSSLMILRIASSTTRADSCGGNGDSLLLDAPEDDGDGVDYWLPPELDSDGGNGDC